MHPIPKSSQAPSSISKTTGKVRKRLGLYLDGKMGREESRRGLEFSRPGMSIFG